MSKHDSPTVDSLARMAEVLRGSQQQCDEDGTMIAVSRQALDETLAMIAALTRPPGDSERLRERLEEARDLLTGRKWGSHARSPAHNARLILDDLLASPQGAVQQGPMPWRNHDAAIDAKALATATEIALMWGQDRSQFVSRIQVAVIEAMRWIADGMPAPQGAEQRQEPTLDQIDRAVRSLPSGYTFGDAVEHATPHPEQAATQGDAVAERDLLQSILSRPAHAHLQGAHLSEPHADCVLCGAIKERTELLAALPTPSGVQAAQVSDDVAALLEAAKVVEATCVRHDGMDALAFRQLRSAIERFAQPSSAAHGGEDAK